MRSDVAVLALAGLPGMGPARLGGLLGSKTSEEIWEMLLTGSQRDRLAVWSGASPRTVERWIEMARQTDLEALAARYDASGVAVHRLGGSGFPTALATDPEPPSILFSQGDLGIINRHARVAVVGTRSCTRYGVDVARELGERLAAAGAAVVSGLAIGIDAAAHAGAMAVASTPPIGVVGSGLDVVYPQANAGLWQKVRDTGLLISEAPLGARPERWRFPARNRIIAALSDLVVVVESHVSGGSLSTVDEALERGRPVMAVPGSILSPASVGTNRLIADGSAPVCTVADVLELLGFDSAAVARPGVVDDAVPNGVQAEVLDAFGWRPVSLESLHECTGLAHGRLALILEELEAGGRIERRGLFYERVASTQTELGNPVARR